MILIAVAFPRYNFIAGERGETRNSILDVMNSWFISLINLCLRSSYLVKKGARKKIWSPLVVSSVINNASGRQLGLIYNSVVKKIINGVGGGIF